MDANSKKTQNQKMNNPTNKTESMPRFWWIIPWIFSIQQWKARERQYQKYLELSKLLAQERLRTIPRHLQWQPIETAPKIEGEWILIFGKQPFYGTDEISFAEYDSDKKLYIDLTGQNIEPTHWMYLPKPPKN